MPRKTSGGKSRKASRARRVTHGEPIVRDSAQREHESRESAPHPVPPNTPSRILGEPASRPATASQSRQSILASVKRPGRPSGQTIITDYSYVSADLKRIAVLAVGAFALMIVLSFVVR